MSKTKRESLIKMKKSMDKNFDAEVLPELIKLIEKAEKKKNGKA